MSGALVGPLRPVRYTTGPTQWHDLPRNTLDIRYSACGNHHLACDCREAMLAEDIGEYRAMYRDLEQAIIDAIKGHQTWAYTTVGEYGTTVDDEFAQCKCPVCEIARTCGVGWSECQRQRREAYEVQNAAERERERTYYAAHFPDLDEVPF